MFAKQLSSTAVQSLASCIARCKDRTVAVLLQLVSYALLFYSTVDYAVLNRIWFSVTVVGTRQIKKSENHCIIFTPHPVKLFSFLCFQRLILAGINQNDTDLPVLYSATLFLQDRIL